MFCGTRSLRRQSGNRRRIGWDKESLLVGLVCDYLSIVKWEVEDWCVYVLAALRKGPTRIACQVERMNVPAAVART
jgi:hypothetical protein